MAREREARTPEVVRTSLGKFAGLYTNADPHDVPPGGAVIQENIRSLVPGMLTPRLGLGRSTDFTPSSPGTDEIQALYGYVRPEGSYAVKQDTGGAWKAVRGSTSVTLASSKSTFLPATFAKHRRNHLLMVTGLDRGIIWNGLTSAGWELGIDAPGSGPTLATPTGGAATAGTYYAAIRFADADTTPNYSSITDLQSTTAVLNDKFTYSWSATSSQSRITSGGFFEVWRSTVDTPNLLYFIKRLGYGGAITSSATNGGFVQFTLPKGHGLAVGATISVSGHSVAGYNTTHEVTAVTDTTVTTDESYTADGTGGAWVCNGYTADTASDNTLIANARNDSSLRLPVVLGNGKVNARRFTVPPNYMSAAVQFQDRTWYGVHAVYDEGTVSTTSGSTTLTGTGTSWTSAMVGRYMYVQGHATPFYISAFSSATSLTASLPASGNLTNATYAIRPDPETRSAIFFSEADEPESVPEFNIVTIQENTGDDDELTGLMPFGSVLYALKERHIYTLTFFQQPQVDADIQLLAERGCVNQRCWDTHEGVMYLMDRMGMYRMSPGGGIEPISQPIHDYFRDSASAIDWTKRKWFHVCVDPVYELVYFFVKFTADSGTRPKRAFVYHIRSGAWWMETFIEEIGASAQCPVSGTLRLLLGGENDQVYLANAQATDCVTAEVRASVTSASSGTTITCSGANFASSVNGAPVVVISGTGKFERRRVTGSTSTSLTVDSAVSVDTTSVVVVGGIPWRFKSGLLDLPDVEHQNARGVDVVYLPTTGACTLDVRRYFNHASSPEDNTMPQDLGTNFTRTMGSPDDVLDLKSARVTGTAATGWGRTQFSGRGTDRMEGKRFVAVELRGVAGDATQLVYDVEVVGAGG